MSHLNVTVFSSPNHTHCFTISPNATWSDLCAFIAQRTDLNVTRLYHNDQGTTLISNDAEWNTLKRRCKSLGISLMTDPTHTTRHSDTMDLSPCNSQVPISFTSQFKRFGTFMDRYSDLIQRDDHVRRLMQQTATDLTLQCTAIDWTDLETQLESKQDELYNSKASWHLAHLAPRSTKPLVGSTTDTLPQGYIWGAYPAYSALHPAPEDYQVQRSPPSLYPLPPPVMPSPSSKHYEKKHYNESNRQQTPTNDPFLERQLYFEHHKQLKKGLDNEEAWRRLKQQPSELCSSTTDALRKSTSLTSLSSSSSSNVSSLNDFDLLNQDHVAPLKYPSIPPTTFVRHGVKKQW